MTARLAAVAYFAALTALVFVGGSLLVARCIDVPGPGIDDRPSPNFTWSVSGGLILCVVLLGAVRWRAHRRRFWFGNILFAVWLPLSLAVTEAVCRRLTPGWPAQALHGVDPAVSRQAWGQGLGPDDVGFNAWGQRDRERTLRPRRGTHRIAFIGDSFLEESSQPVSLVAERLIARDDCEIVNLGVSATQPDEYYDRLQGVALPLGCRHCVVWLFSGNDFADEPRTLRTYAGFCAVAPRPSLLTVAGCRSINHLLTNSQRPVLLTWFSAGGLAAREKLMFEQFRAAGDDELRRQLFNLRWLPPPAAANLESRLRSSQITEFFEVLRAPDAEKFRSYYLHSALLSAAAGQGQWDPNPEAPALYWAKQMQRVCAKRGAALTLAVIPEAFQVDPRMCDQWSPLTDMRHVTRPCRDAAERFCAAARAEGLDVLDLHPVFQDVPGMYLNLDGHWSQAGAELAAQAVVEHLRPQLPAR